MTSRKHLVLAVLLLMLVGGASRAHAQTLDDAIDAELDSVDTTPAKPSQQTENSKPSVSDVQLDEGGAGPSPGVVQDELSDSELGLDGTEAPKKEQAAVSTPDAPQNQETKLETPPASGVDDINLDAATDVPLDVPAETPTESPVNTPTLEAKSPGVPDAPKIATTAESVVIDGGNSAYEKKLSKISSGYRQVPDVSWDEVVGSRREENYKLQRGDTLWDISETFFGDGFYWAKLWSQNGVIDNPHHVLKGKGVKFVAGTEADAPAIGVMDVSKSGAEYTSVNPLEQEGERPTYREQVQSEVTPEEIESGVVLETDELIPAPELPAPSKRVPLLKTLPKSFVETHIEGEADYDATGLQSIPAIRARVAPSIFVTTYILDGSPDDIGRVDEIEAQEKTASTGQSVFVNLKKEMPIGSRVTFLRRRERPAGAAGPVIDVLGIGVIDGVVKENSNVYRAMVTTTLLPVEKGALVSAEPPPRITVTRSGRRSDARVKVVGGEFDENRKQLGMPAVVYLNGGTNAGLAKGDILGISAQRGSRREDTKYASYSHPIAVVKIADVHEKVATAIVLTSTLPVMIGDMTSGEMPEDLPTLHAESADEAATAFGRKDPSQPSELK